VIRLIDGLPPYRNGESDGEAKKWQQQTWGIKQIAQGNPNGMANY